MNQRNTAIICILLLLFVNLIYAMEYIFDDQDYDNRFNIYNVSCITGDNATFNRYKGNFSGELTGTFIHELNGTNHTGNLSANRVVKDTGTNFIGWLLDVILDFLSDRDDAINTTSNIEGLINNTIDTKVINANDSMKIYVNAQDVIYNESMVTHDKSTNDSMKIYVDDKIINLNESVKLWVYNGTFYLATEVYTMTEVNTHIASNISGLNESVKLWVYNGSFYLATEIDTHIASNITGLNESVKLWVYNGSFYLTTEVDTYIASNISGLNESVKIWVYNGTLQPNITSQSCTGTNKVSSFKDGTFTCTTDIDSNASTGCNDGYYLDGNGLCIHFNNTVLDLTKSITYNATSISTIEGTLDGGNITSVQNIDTEWYNVSENAGGSPLLIEVNFTGVVTFSNVLLRTQYIGGQGHEIEIQTWNYDSSSWESHGDITDQSTMTELVVDVLDASDHVSGGLVQLRFDHQQNGLPSHDFLIDYVALQEGFTSITSAEHDSLLGRDDKLNHPWAFPKDASRNITGQLNGTTALFEDNVTSEAFLSNNWDNTTITESQISDLSPYLINGTDATFNYLKDTNITNASISAEDIDRDLPTDCPAGNAVYGFGNNMSTTLCRNSWVNIDGDTMTGDLIVPTVNGSWNESVHYALTTDIDSWIADNVSGKPDNGSDANFTNINVNNTYIGYTDQDQYIYFYEDSSATGEHIMWNNSLNRFFISDSLVVQETLEVSSVIYAGNSIYTSGDLYTTGTGVVDGNLWLGTPLWYESNLIAYASGDLFLTGTINSTSPVKIKEGVLVNDTGNLLLLNGSGQICNGTDNVNWDCFSYEDTQADLSTYLQNETDANFENLDVAGQIYFHNPAYPTLRNERSSTTLTNNILSGLDQLAKTTQNMVDGFGAGMSFTIEDSSDVKNRIADIQAIRDGADNTGKLLFSTRRTGTVTGQMSLISDPYTRVNVFGPATTSMQLMIGRSDAEGRVLMSWNDNTDIGYFTSATGGSYAPFYLRGNPLGFNDNNAYNVHVVAGGGNLGIGTATPNEKLTVAGNTNITGRISANLTHVFGLATKIHTVAAEGVWYNITMNRTHADSSGFSLSTDNMTIIVPHDSHYTITYGMGIMDSDASPSAHVAMRIEVNGAELSGSYIEYDTHRQATDYWLEHITHAELSKDDTIRLQYIASADTVTISQEDTYAAQGFSAFGYIQEVIH